MYLIDTNIFLASLLGEKRAPACEEFLKRCYAKDVSLVITSFTLHSIEVMLLKRGKKDVLESFLEKLSASSNMHVYPTAASDELGIFRLCKKGRLDFDDSFQYYVAQQSGCKAIVSYDADFEDLEVPQTTPEELLDGVLQ